MIIDERQTGTGKSKISVVKNSCYELLYDLSKNRIYFTIHGFWKNKEAVPCFLNDWKKILSLTMPGYTVLADLTDMLTQPQELNELHLKAQQLMKGSGLLLIAQVGPKDKIATLQVEETYCKSGIPLKKYSSVEAADSGLDNLAANYQ